MAIWKKASFMSCAVLGCHYHLHLPIENNIKVLMVAAKWLTIADFSLD
ncbi:hypothetical protein NWP17_05835 [Chrysosporum bergii ANA360D]|jgi:hypothetical protein|uniref:Uncharacterized protein n=1 Tax=Chrysosporum bergii ANA360D TaxID=617107 RepID=A0AA43GRF2_9CYAN|nr:hypothetical protein [Chrysosporum bergii]MDH6059961.1 hypothetical protein [Chrysosporum bergii ANA360D]